MLPKENRLPSPRILTILGSGVRVRGDGITITYVNNNLPASRFAFIVSSSIDTRATIRNRMKRQMREGVRHLVTHLMPCVDAVCKADTRIHGKSTMEISSILKKAFVQQKLLPEAL